MQSNHTQEISQLHIQSMETIEQMRIKYEAQMDNNKLLFTSIQTELQAKVNNYEHQVSGIHLVINNKCIIYI